VGAARRAGGFGPSSDACRDDLDAFVSEIRPLLVSVPAYPEQTATGDAAPAVRRRRATSRPLRRLASAVWRGAGAVAYAPIAVVLFAVRVSWWVASSATYAAWRGVAAAVTGVLSLCAATVGACSRGFAATIAFIRTSAVAAGNAGVSAVRGALGLGAAVVGGCVRGWQGTVALIQTSIVAAGHALMAVVRAVAAAAYALVVMVRRAVAAVAGFGAAAVTGCVRGVSATVAFVRASIVAAGHAFMVMVRAVAAAGYALVAIVRRAVHALRGFGAATVTSCTRAGSATASVVKLGMVAGGGACRSAMRTLATGVHTLAARAAGMSRALVHRLGARLKAINVVVRVSPALKPTVASQTWRRRAVLAPALGIVILAGVATASTVLVISRRPAPRASATPAPAVAAVSAALSPVVAAAPLAPARVEAVVRPAVARVKPKDDVRRADDVDARPAVNPDTVRRIWLKTDTRSLDRALSSVRQATLAFSLCNVQMTATDQAIARCEVARTGSDRKASSWTIEFSRADERWRIDGISAKR
jgi:hypothetical protein